MKKLYRVKRALYDEKTNIDTIRIYYEKFDVIKETEKSYLINVNNKTKRVYKNGVNSFAFDTEEKALENFKHRTIRSVKICRRNLEVAKIYYEKFCKP